MSETALESSELSERLKSLRLRLDQLRGRL